MYIDAIQYAPHGLINVQVLDCAFLTALSYKFLGLHSGVLYGKYKYFEELKAYRVRPAPKDPPGKFETGTQNHESIAGMLGAIEYLLWVGRTFGGIYEGKYAKCYQGRWLQLKQAMTAIRAYEDELSRALLEILEETPGLTLYGLRDVRRLEERVPTFSFTLQYHHARQVAERLGDADIYVWDGNYYALAVTERLGLEESGGMVRVGAIHYTTAGRKVQIAPGSVGKLLYLVKVNKYV